MKRTAVLRRTPLPKFGKKKDRLGSVAQRQEYDGAIYHSKLEAQYAAKLDMLMSCKDPAMRVTSWERQVRMPLDVNGVHICNYVVDFRVKFADGRTEFIEVKGFSTDLWRMKEKLFRACYPSFVLRVVR